MYTYLGARPGLDRHRGAMDIEAGPPGTSGSPDTRASLNTSNATLANNGPRQRPPRSLPRMKHRHRMNR